MLEEKSATTPGGAPRKLIAGRYEVLRSLGRGGMGKVFLVWDHQTGKKLAMKLLRNKWQQNERVVARFAREVQALQQLNHPCIAKIYDARRDGDHVFYTMDYVKGKSVRDWLLERGRLRFGSVVRVLCMVAHALDHAHQFTIHRDISPDNVMVMADGSVRLLDFGLAKLKDTNQQLTMIGVNMGKVQYNAPEQQINAAAVDHRADIYPLGVMFYEMLTGQRPDGKHRLLDLRPDLPAECEAFWEKAMAARPEDRFSSAMEFHEALLEVYRIYEEGKTGKIQDTQEEMPTQAPAKLVRKRSGFLARLNPFGPLARFFRKWREGAGKPPHQSR